MKRVTGLHWLDRMLDVKPRSPEAQAQAEHDRVAVEAMAEKVRARRPDGKLKPPEYFGATWGSWDGRKMWKKDEEEDDARRFD